MVIIQRKNFHSLKLNFRISLTKLLTYLVVRMLLEENNLQKAQLFFANCRWEWQKNKEVIQIKLIENGRRAKKLVVDLSFALLECKLCAMAKNEEQMGKIKNHLRKRTF